LPSTVAPARSPPQAELDFDQTADTGDWLEVDQTPGAGDDLWD
jgi:hypothetical protein